MIYCTKCGSPLFDGAVACPTCGNPVANQQQPVRQPAQQPQFTPQTRIAPIPSTENYGLGKAIAGIVIGFITLLLTIIYQGDSLGGYFLFFVITACIPLFILSIVYGASSIGNFKTAVNNFHRCPIATLILGILALTLGVFCAGSFSYYVLSLIF